MYGEGGYLYMYLIYGMYWMLNIVAGQENSPQAVLIRGVEKYPGPGRLTKVFSSTEAFMVSHWSIHRGSGYPKVLLQNIF